MGCNGTLVGGEDILCTGCIHRLPIAHGLIRSDDKVRELFYGRTDVVAATSLFYYEKIGVVQRMIHELKYGGQQEISGYLGNWLGALMKEDGRFESIDYVVPVPVHEKRFRQRGYNQVTGFGKVISEVLGSRFRESVLIKTRNTIKQARLNQKSRSDESSSPYQLAETLPAGSSVLLVDDVITTGTTLSLCAKELAKIPDLRLYVATMAVSV